MMKYSIIVPLYNCEQYIEKCLESLLDQNYEGEYEVIVVNDGSVDGSLSIVQKISVSSKGKIKIVSQKNKGLSGARNTGLRMAIGQYIIFIDADDYVENSLLKTVDQAMANQDLLLYGYYNDTYYNDERRSSDSKIFISQDIEECARNMNPLSFSGLIGYAWNKVYRREFLLEKNIWFREGTSLVEDIIFNRAVFACATNIGVTSDPLVHYIQRINRETLSKKKYDNLNALLIESFEGRKEIFQRYDPEKYKESMTPVFELMLAFILNYGFGDSKLIGESCLMFFDSCKNDINIELISNRLMKICLKYRWYQLLAVAYRVKSIIR